MSEQDALRAALTWAEGRIDDALHYAASHPRPVGADFYRDVLLEVLEEVRDALERADAVRVAEAGR